jgi:hypothetical protein
VGTQAATLDVKVVYRTIPVIPIHKQFIIVGCGGLFCMDHNTPFGLKPSSGMQGEVVDATIDIWFSMAIGLVKKWVDDFVLFRYPLEWGEHIRNDNDPEYQY